MKKRNSFIKYVIGFSITGIMVMMLSCSKKDDAPAPKTVVTPPPSNEVVNEMCGDSICKLPFRLLTVFVPSGFYDTGEQTTKLTFDSTGGVSTYPNQSVRIVYTNGGGYWGAHFLNENNWTGTFKVTPAATKITFYVKSNYSANVTFNAFGQAQYGKVELYKLGAPITPVWEKVTINLLGKPDTFNAPLNIVIDGVTTNGQVTIVDIKDLIIE